MQTVDPRSFLFITLDSCRYDVFEAARAPNMKGVGPLHRASAPGNFTFASHAAMFVGFTPGDAFRSEPFVNPKFGKIFKMIGGGFSGKVDAFLTLRGRNIIDGFKNLGYRTVGTAAVRWFNPRTHTGRVLTEHFDDFFYARNTHSLPQQLPFLEERIRKERKRPLFIFLNVGETHVPYYFEGADWRADENPCVPFGARNDRAECWKRQLACIEFADQKVGPLLEMFAGANTIICSDHGDAWGEDGLWEHGFHHSKVIEVPLLFQLHHKPPSAKTTHRERIRALARYLGKVTRA